MYGLGEHFSQKTDANGPWKPWQMCCRCYLLYTKTCNWTWSVLFPVSLLGLILTSWMRPVSLELTWIKQCSDINQFEGLLPARGDVISMRCASKQTFRFLPRLAGCRTNVWEPWPCWCPAVVRLICWDAPSELWAEPVVFTEAPSAHVDQSTMALSSAAHCFPSLSRFPLTFRIKFPAGSRGFKWASTALSLRIPLFSVTEDDSGLKIWGDFHWPLLNCFFIPPACF